MASHAVFLLYFQPTSDQHPQADKKPRAYVVDQIAKLTTANSSFVIGVVHGSTSSSAKRRLRVAWHAFARGDTADQAAAFSRAG
jgi:hypothetical protein